MNKFFAAIVALIVLVAAIIVLAPNLVPASAYKDKIEAAAENALGRDVTLGDEISFKIFPRVAFSVSPLEIANAEGFEGAYLVRVERADIGVKLMPLLSETIEVDQFVLTSPDINLQKAADGRVNWDLANKAVSQSETATLKASGQREFRLGDVRIVNGKAVYADAEAGQTYTFEDIDASVRLDSLDEPLEVDGSMLFQGTPTKVDLVLTSLGQMQRQEESNLKLDITLGDATAGADLTLAAGETFSYSGPVSLNAPDLPALAALFDVQLADAPGFDKLAATGQARGGVNGIQLSGAKIDFDEIDATGDLALNWAGAKPKATGALSAGTLDLRPYMPPPTTSADGFPAWSEAKFDFSSLKNIDADISVTAEQVFLNELKAGVTRMQIKIENGRLTADIPQLDLYGGGGSGRLIVNATRATPSFAGVFDFSSVEAQPFSKDLMKMDRLLGLGGLKLDFTASGDSQAAIMRSIDGSGGFDLNDGALKGVNIAKLVRAVGDLQSTGFSPAGVSAAIAQARAPGEQTDFSKFLSHFTITDGVVNAPTINLVGPFLTMNGMGTINLPAQGVDLRLAPRATTTVDGEGGQAYTIPVRITGTFSEPKIGVDVESIVRGRAESVVRDLIGGALGGNQDDSDADGDGGSSEEEEAPASQILRGILGGSRDDAPAQESDENGSDPSGGQARNESATDPAEAIALDAINQLFGTAQPADPPADGSDDEQAPPD